MGQCFADSGARALPFGPSSVVAVVHDGNPESGCNCLAECHGDCDSDSDCIGHLLCHQRDGDAVPTGCSGAAHSDVTDYCYDPIKWNSGYGYAPETCQLACIEYQYFAVQDVASPYGGQCFCGKSLADATQYGPSSGCPGEYLSYANDVYENLLYANLKSSGSWRLIAAKQITAVTDEAANLGDVAKDTVVVVKVPQFGFEVFMFAVVAISAVLCAGWWCRGVGRKKTYAKVSYVSEAETEENAAMNDEQL